MVVHEPIAFWENWSKERFERSGAYALEGALAPVRIDLDNQSGTYYETVGYVISGSARLDLEGQTLNLKAGDLWLVPAGAMHQYTIIEPFTAVEATAPPAEVHGRDTPA